MLLLIRLRKVISREELAARYNISKRTVQRCVNELIAAGIPVKSSKGKQGGYYIPDNYKLDCTMFTPEDFSRLSVCLDALSRTFKDELTGDLISKLYGLAECEMPDYSVMSFSPKLVIDGDSWSNSSVKSVKLDTISAAVSSEITIDINYMDKRGQPSRRLVDPYSLVLKEGVWYVYGKCHKYNDFRLFRVARIKSIEVTGKEFVREGGNVREALKADFGEKIAIELEVDEGAIASIEEWLGTGAVEPDGDKYIVKSEVIKSEELVRRLLSYGTCIRIIRPDELRENMRLYAEKIAKHYRE